MRKLAVSLLALAGLALAGAASADPIGPLCGTCQGSIYTLEYSGFPISVDIPNNRETFRIYLTIDTAGYNAGGLFIDTVAIKVAPQIFSATLFDAPTGAGNWTTWLGGLNANGCSGSGSGFDCAAAWFSGVSVPSGTPYAWAWDVEITDGTLFTGALASSIKVRYVDGNNVKVGALVSEGITLQTNPDLIPEPATAALLGGGLLALAFARRRRR